MTNHENTLGQPVGAPLDMVFPRPRPPLSAMQGRVCSVVPLDIDRHSDALYRAFCADTDGRNWTYLPYGPFESEEDFRIWLLAGAASSDPLFHTVLDFSGAPVGIASYLRIDPAAGSIEVGHIHFSPALQKTATASEAMFLMMRRAFDELGYRRYEWKCDALNGPSKRAAERFGFTYEGTFRKATHYKGRNRDTAWFAIVDDDWPAVRDAFEQWLAPENFDEAGQQRTPLAARRD